MTENSTTECLLFPDLFPRPVTMEFNQRQGSSDGGAVLLKAAERRYDLVSRLSGCMVDNRQAGKVDHQLAELTAQRIYSIACGYADANDAARLKCDPVHKMLLGRDPIAGLDLASQPSLSRFENAAGPRQLYRMGGELAAGVIERHARRLNGHARRVTIDLDPTDDPTHGAQQLSFFNGHYDTACYLPMMGFISFDGEADQYLVAAVLRPGNVPAGTGAVGILQRLMALIRRHFRKARIRVRLDGGFAGPALFDFLDSRPGVEYVVAMAANAVLNREAEEDMKCARALSALFQQTEHVYGETRYKAGSWGQERRVIFKAEVVQTDGKAPRDNPRFVVTNMKQTPRWLYEKLYCRRGEIENRIKELHALEIDRTSCPSFWANQFRVLLTATAYVLMQELRLQAALTDCARAQVWILRDRLLKLGTQVAGSVRRMVVRLPQSFPFLKTFQTIALALGAAAP